MKLYTEFQNILLNLDHYWCYRVIIFGYKNKDFYVMEEITLGSLPKILVSQSLEVDFST